MWGDFIGILELEIKDYQGVLRLLKEQQQLIIKNKVEEIEIINQQLQTIYDRTSALEKQRLALINQLASDLKTDSQLLNMTKIKEYLPIEYQENYASNSEQLKKIIYEIQHENKNNQDLLKMSLAYVDFSLNLYAGSNHSSYGQQGQEQANGREKSFFNCKV